jgi:hypothetical protein
MTDHLEERPNRAPEPRWFGPRILAGAAAGLLVAAGMCGVSLKWHGHEGLNGLGVFAFLVAGASALALLIGAIVFVIELFTNSRRKE